VLLTLPIRQVVRATPRARIVRLDLNGHAFDYAPGQAVVVGAHGGDARRPYSIAASPEDALRDRCLELLVGVDADGRAGVHLPLEPETAIDVEGPLGAFTFPADPEARRFVFIAGGTGIAPLRAMLHRALAVPHDDVGLLYSARTPEEFAYEDEFLALARAGRIALRQTITRAQDADWRGARGRFDRDALAALVHDVATLCFVCGPQSLVEEMKARLAEIGVPTDRVRAEEWG
jgi:ferredoxin-NADP reductase